MCFHYHISCRISASFAVIYRHGSRAAAASKMEHFVITVKGWEPLTISTKRSILDVAAVLDPSLHKSLVYPHFHIFCMMNVVRT